MDPDPMQFVEDGDENKKSSAQDAAAARARLNTWVAISVALLATTCSHFSDLSSRNYSYKFRRDFRFLAPPISLPA